MGKKGRWTWHSRIFGYHVYISDHQMRARPANHNLYGAAKLDALKRKDKLYERQQHCCAICCRESEITNLEQHHVLPHSRFPDLRTSIRNIMLVCKDCHHELHQNPFLNIKLMQNKAKELGIDLNEHFKC